MIQCGPQLFYFITFSVPMKKSSRKHIKLTQEFNVFQQLFLQAVWIPLLWEAATQITPFQDLQITCNSLAWQWEGVEGNRCMTIRQTLRLGLFCGLKCSWKSQVSSQLYQYTLSILTWQLKSSWPCFTILRIYRGQYTQNLKVSQNVLMGIVFWLPHLIGVIDIRGLQHR